MREETRAKIVRMKVKMRVYRVKSEKIKSDNHRPTYRRTLAIGWTIGRTMLERS